MPQVIEKTDAQYEAESDALALVRASVILNNPKRLKAAQKAAEILAKDEIEHLESLLKVANKGKTVEGMRVLESD